MNKIIYRKQHAFTIVELLIVIVIIAILAAITIVAFNGVQDRARSSAAASSSTQAAKRIKLWQVDNENVTPTCSKFYELVTGTTSGAPANPTPPATGPCSFTYIDTNYQYASYTGGAYCATATVVNKSYKVTESVSPQGDTACAGHGQGGVDAITNLVNNPSFEVTSITNTNGAASISNPIVGDAVSGTRVSRITRNDTASSGGWWDVVNPATANTTYTVCLSVRGTDPTNRPVRVEWINTAGSAIISNITIVNTGTVTSTWQRVCGTATSPADTGRLRLAIYGAGGAAGSYFDLDAIMVTQGTTQYSFADGNSNNWAWNGTVNNSTSTGPPL